MRKQFSKKKKFDNTENVAVFIIFISKSRTSPREEFFEILNRSSFWQFLMTCHLW